MTKIINFFPKLVKTMIENKLNGTKLLAKEITFDSW